MPRIILVFFVAFGVFPAGYVFARDAETSRAPIEIFADGKRYPSLHAYKLQQLKDHLRGVLSSGQLREFSAEEISAIIREIQNQPPVMAQLPAPKPAVSPADARSKLIEEALENYNAQYGDDPASTIDSVRGKTIIIKPPSRDVSSNVQKTDTP